MPKVLVVVGPTAAGKSAMAIRLASEFNGEIINTDSMQLYRGLDIGTAKVPADQRGGIPHHLLDIWNVDHPATVSQFQQLARAQIADVTARGRLAVLVGGSGLYVNAVIDDLKFPGTVPQVRQRWEAELLSIGPVALHDLLAERDPAAAAKMEPGNGRRIVRALEVIEITGEPYPAQLPTDRPYLPATVVGLTLDRPTLDRRIEQRVKAMWDQGFVDEVRELIDQGLRGAPTASRALGYAQILKFLAGETDEAAAREATIVGTRRFARRQLSWFLRDSRVRWIDVDYSSDSASTQPELVWSRVLAAIEQGGHA